MNTLQTLVNIALYKPDYRERALHQLRRNANKFHAMEVEAMVEDLEYQVKVANSDINIWIRFLKSDSENRLANGFRSIASIRLQQVLDVYEVIKDIHTANKNGALA